MAHLLRVKRTSQVMFNLDGPVGPSGANLRDDVTLVQWLLNMCQVRVVIGEGTRRQSTLDFPLAEDGFFGPKTSCMTTILLHGFASWKGVKVSKFDPIRAVTGSNALEYLNESAQIGNALMYDGVANKKLPAAWWARIPRVVYDMAGKPAKEI